MATTTTAQSQSSKGEKLALRLSHILALLHQGDTIDKHQLAEDFKVDVRTIERDLGQRLHGIAERNGDGRWQLTHTARSTIPAKHLLGYSRLAGIEHLFPDPSLRYLLAQLETPEPHRATHVQPIPNEDLRGQGPRFALLQNAIEHQHECRFTYKAKLRRTQPYRLIHKNGVWYLAAEEEGSLKNFSVALIETLEVDETSHFIPNPAHQAYINAKDDVWFTAETTEVLGPVRISVCVAH